MAHVNPDSRALNIILTRLQENLTGLTPMRDDNGQVLGYPRTRNRDGQTYNPWTAQPITLENLGKRNQGDGYSVVGISANAKLANPESRLPPLTFAIDASQSPFSGNYAYKITSVAGVPADPLIAIRHDPNQQTVELTIGNVTATNLPASTQVARDALQWIKGLLRDHVT
jgi:hypothetical protein